MKKISFNWGWGIFLFFSLFVCFMVFMVYKTSTINHDLVATDYYQQEIDFQKKIDSRNNLIKSGKHVTVVENNSEVQIILPKTKEQVIENIKICFYRPSDEKKDIKLNYPSGEIFVVTANQFIKGEYIMQAEWTIENTHYYEEIKFVKS